MRRVIDCRLMILLLGAAALLGSCFADRGVLGAAATGGMAGMGASDALGGVPAQGAEGGTAPGVCVARPPVEGATCQPVVSAEPLYLKLVKDEPQDVTVFVDDLFLQFKTHCGGCHVDTNLGDTPFQANLQNFSRNVGQKALDAIRSNTAACSNAVDCVNYMPPAGSPAGKAWSDRGDDPDDPMVRFATLLEEWIKQDRPADYFILPAEKGGKSPYSVDEAFAASLTNIGSCVPDEGMVATEAGDSCDLDARFAAMQKDPTSGLAQEKLGLPLTLDQTDLVTLDSAQLAQLGVIAYAPTYPLWTDDAGKLRHVRVPRGESIRFNPETKNFDIPPNTRFYKTFLKEVLALDGKKRFRKIETRLIVSRAGDEPLFGTYEWNDSETQATLVTSPLRNGEPFTDILKIVITDEPKAAEIKKLKDEGKIRNYTYELDAQHAARRYAMPGRERCIQCHEGSESFILGFTPLQVNRRPCAEETLAADGYCEGGVLEPAGADEVSQLERLISYGVITNFDTEKDLIRLEDPQGSAAAPRPFRTPQELVAQGYLLGNCAHCHNPIGYPTKLNPELGELLDFIPSEKGGVFGFPLERYSPRIQRGATAEIKLPYITPSLRDIAPATSDPARANSPRSWEPKIVQVRGEDGTLLNQVIDAPWRSLIYRNVDTPFTYSEHFAIYPHMPLNSPGFDCRAPRIMGDWMVSIPAVKKHPELNEDLETGFAFAETDPQPYVEVPPGAPNYPGALMQAQKRLATYRNGNRYKSYCPDTSDIVDIDVVRGKRIVPADATLQAPGGGLLLPAESVPDRPHWVVTDLSDAPGEWTPRRTDWKSVFGELPPPAPSADQATKDAWAAEKQVLDMLEELKLSDAFRAFAKEELPFGVWQTKAECAGKLAKQTKLGDYKGAERRRWMRLFADAPGEEAKAELPVYKTTPGAAVFNMICVNCHGPDADSRGRQASTLQDMTGGTGRVANFRDGFFGPPGTGGGNRERVFGSDDQAVRYLAWMALGGTKTKIPQSILSLVTNTQVLGMKREGFNASTKTANMLQVAQNLCLGVAFIGAEKGEFRPHLLSPTEMDGTYEKTGLITKNGDAELWKKLCSFDNPAPVHVGRVLAPASGEPRLFLPKDELHRAQAYPAGERIGTELGTVAASLTPDNYVPWCVRAPQDPQVLEWLSQQKGSDGSPFPICPPAFAVEGNRLETTGVGGEIVYTELNRWAARGAINVGFAVFLFLDDFIGGDKPRPPRYNECELLPD